MMVRLGRRRLGVRLCWIRPICSARASNTPKAPSGLVLRSILWRRAGRMAGSGAWMVMEGRAGMRLVPVVWPAGQAARESEGNPLVVAEFIRPLLDRWPNEFGPT